VPQIASLRLDDLFARVKMDVELAKRFPVAQKEWAKLPRDWVCAVLNTYDRAGFQQMVKAARDAQYQKKVVEKKEVI
jgi:hypothetical protein